MFLNCRLNCALLSRSLYLSYRLSECDAKYIYVQRPTSEQSEENDPKKRFIWTNALTCTYIHTQTHTHNDVYFDL